MEVFLHIKWSKGMFIVGRSTLDNEFFSSWIFRLQVDSFEKEMARQSTARKTFLVEESVN